MSRSYDKLDTRVDYEDKFEIPLAVRSKNYNNEKAQVYVKLNIYRIRILGSDDLALESPIYDIVIHNLTSWVSYVWIRRTNVLLRWNNSLSSIKSDPFVNMEKIVDLNRLFNVIPSIYDIDDSPYGVDKKNGKIWLRNRTPGFNWESYF